MTTNQTIDGVPREHLAAWAERLECADSGFPGSVPFLKELRALLDAPSVQWLAMEVNGKPWVIKEGPNADKWRAMGYELLPVAPAAQHQGGPVEIGYIEHSREFESQLAPVINRLIWTMPADQRHKIPQHYKVMLYAEQPAPASVALPVDPERERLMEIVQQYPNVDPLKYDAAVRTLRK